MLAYSAMTRDQLAERDAMEFSRTCLQLCGWCGKVLGRVERAPGSALTGESHGICEECAAKLLKELEE